MLKEYAEGTAKWTCPHCNVEQEAEASHPELYHARDVSIALPMCACGSQTFLHVPRDESYRTAPNMINEDGSETDSCKAILRHKELSTHLHTMGKTEHAHGYVPPSKQKPIAQERGK